MGKIKSFLAYTNPVAVFLGMPVLCGIILSVISHNVFGKTFKIVKSLDKNF